LQFGLTTVALSLYYLLLFVEQSFTQVLDLLILLSQPFLLFAAQLVRVQLVGLAEFILVAFDESLDFWFEAFHSLRPNIVNALILPFLAAHFLTRQPCILIFLELNLIALLHKFLLLGQVSILVLLIREEFLDPSCERIFVFKQLFNHGDLLLHSHRVFFLCLLNSALRLLLKVFEFIVQGCSFLLPNFLNQD
jgi:hypothetical protein